GSAPYTITWGDGGTNTLNSDGIINITALPPGNYTFIVTDAAGCLTSVDLTVPQASDPISLTGTPPSLCSSDDGSITVTMEEGFPPYTITLNGALEVTTNGNPYTFEGLSAGLYTVSVEYGFICEAEAFIELNTPGFVCKDGWSSIDPVCPGDPAYLYFDGSGNAEETFQIRQVNSGFLITSVPGNEEVFIEVQYSDYEVRRVSTEDECVCEFMLSIAPVNFEAQLTVIDGSCEPGNVIPGSITLSTATGGTPPYAIQVNTLNGDLVDGENLNAGSYIVTVLDANNCELTDTVEVEGGFLTDGIEEDEVVVCEGDTFQPTFDNASGPNLTFSWSPTTGLSDPNVASPVITPTEDITYVLTITDPNCGTFTDTLVIDFVPGLNMSVDGNAFFIGQNSIDITVSSDNDEAIYTWYQGDDVIVDNDGDDTFTLAIDDLAPPYYVVGVVNDCPDTLFFNVIPPPEVDFTVSVADVDICEGESTTLQATILPDTILIDSIVWVDAQGASIGLGTEITLDNLVPGTYTYTITAFSPLGLAQTTVTVSVLPIPVIDAQPDGVLSLCTADLGNLVELTATATGYPDSTIVWSDQSGSPLGTGGTIMVPVVEGANQYTATISTTCGDASDVVTIEVNSAPVPPALPDTLKLCIGQDTVLDLTGYAFSYVWSECDGPEIPVVGDNLVIAADNIGETCYRFSATNSCGTAEEEVIVFVAPEQQVDAQPNDTIQMCEPAMDTCLTATVIGLPAECIEWTDLAGNVLGVGEELCVTPPLGFSQYIASIPGLDCISSDTVSIMVGTLSPPPPDFPDTLTICLNQDTVLDLSSYNHPYTWSDCDGNILAESGDEIQISGNVTGEQCFIFSASNDCGSVEEQVFVIVIPEPEITTVPDTTIQLCGPVTEAVVLTATAPGFAESAISWIGEDGSVLGTGETYSVVPPVGTCQYIARVVSGCGSASDTVTIVVDNFIPPPPAGL
ncbi:MAG: hypothetical protein HRU12_12505, partial [Phaeodactylibacter sp.]|nr:hypothetical protein [Phaeodactylibacter sp.]